MRYSTTNSGKNMKIDVSFHWQITLHDWIQNTIKKLSSMSQIWTKFYKWPTRSRSHNALTFDLRLIDKSLLPKNFFKFERNDALWRWQGLPTDCHLMSNTTSTRKGYYMRKDTTLERILHYCIKDTKRMSIAIY